MSLFPPAERSVTGARYASFMHRAAAMAIDLVPLYILALLLTSITPEIGVLLWLCCCLAYFTFFIGGPWQATPGKRAMGLVVIHRDGSTISRAYALGRCVAYLASWIIFALGFVLAAFTAERTALHDLF